jgi:hypothetical protein
VPRRVIPLATIVAATSLWTGCASGPSVESGCPLDSVTIGRDAAIDVARALAADPAVTEWHATLSADGPVCVWDVWSSPVMRPAGTAVTYTATIDAGTGRPVTELMVIGTEPAPHDPGVLLYSHEPDPQVVREGMIEFIEPAPECCSAVTVDRAALPDVARELGLSASLAPLRALLDGGRNRCVWMISSLLEQTEYTRIYRVVRLDANTREVVRDEIEERRGGEGRIRPVRFPRVLGP